MSLTRLARVRGKLDSREVCKLDVNIGWYTLTVTGWGILRKVLEEIAWSVFPDMPDMPAPLQDRIGKGNGFRCWLEAARAKAEVQAIARGYHFIDITFYKEPNEIDVFFASL